MRFLTVGSWNRVFGRSLCKAECLAESGDEGGFVFCAIVALTRPVCAAKRRRLHNQCTAASHSHRVEGCKKVGTRDFPHAG
uniref:Secreted protein n=1 Tax=Steinernema glaseri TaxID=37863 RepID=A0A1I7YX37_9BILA